MKPSYVYRAVVEAVHDGDTIRCLVDLGFSVYTRVLVRLSGINARELSEPGGKEAREHLRSLCSEGSTVTLVSLAVDKYGGRADAYVQLFDGRELGAAMVGDGYAVSWTGVGPKPIPPWPIP